MLNIVDYAIAKKEWEKAYGDVIELGSVGRNILLNSEGEYAENSYNSNLLYIDKADTIISGETYTISFDAKTSNGTDSFYISTYVNISTTYQRLLTLSPTAEYQRYSYTFNASDGSENTRGLFVVNRRANNPNNTGYLYIKNLKLEKGKVSTEWVPAIEESDLHPFVAKLSEITYQSAVNKEDMESLRNAVISMGGSI